MYVYIQTYILTVRIFAGTCIYRTRLNRMFACIRIQRNYTPVTAATMSVTLGTSHRVVY